MSNKESFIEYLKTKSPKDSGKPTSYARAMKVIEDVLFTEKFSNTISIWDFINSNNVEKIYHFIAEQQQKKEDGIFKDYTPKSYWEKGYCSAALKEYSLFLKTLAHGNESIYTPINLSFKNFFQALGQAQLNFPKSLSIRFISSLQTKPFTILTGLSGSGKTKLAEAFSLWICENLNQICMVAVGADWTNREPLLGFPNALEANHYVKPESGVLDIIISASKDPKRPYFLILDEMNMSHVERYFADFLSAMESTDGTISLHSGTEDWDGVPPSIELPKNLFIIGTVNIDETTYMFSPKVLDRANVIEFRVSNAEMKSFFEEPKGLNMESLRGAGASMAESFVAKALETDLVDKKLGNALMPFFRMLQKAGAEFGYRTAVEMSRFVALCSELAENNMSKDEVVDAAIMQKLLPKLHGSRNKIESILKELGKLCLTDSIDSSHEVFGEKVTDSDIKYLLSYEKLKRMHDRVLADGFTSFAEA